MWIGKGYNIVGTKWASEVGTPIMNPPQKWVWKLELCPNSGTQNT